MQAMLFAMLQEQHNKKTVAMTATNKANMDTMMERMNETVVGGGGRHPTHQNKESIPTIGSSLPTSTESGITQHWRQTRTSAGQAGSWSIPSPDKHRESTKLTLI
jgi:hypothetical protein